MAIKRARLSSEFDKLSSVLPGLHKINPADTQEPILSDVVVGDPAYACDRLLDQTPAAMRDDVIDAFLAPLGRTRASFNAARRLNVLHEALRYHDELAWLALDDVVHANLTKSVQSQLTVVSRHL